MEQELWTGRPTFSDRIIAPLSKRADYLVYVVGCVINFGRTHFIRLGTTHVLACIWDFHTLRRASGYWTSNLFITLLLLVGLSLILQLLALLKSQPECAYWYISVATSFTLILHAIEEILIGFNHSGSWTRLGRGLRVHRFQRRNKIF